MRIPKSGRRRTTAPTPEEARARAERVLRGQADALVRDAFAKLTTAESIYRGIADTSAADYCWRATDVLGALGTFGATTEPADPRPGQ